MSLRPSVRVDVRKKNYKLAVDADDARRKREDNLVEIRKSKREENLQKKRREGNAVQPASFPSYREKKGRKNVSTESSLFFVELHPTHFHVE